MNDTSAFCIPIKHLQKSFQHFPNKNEHQLNETITTTMYFNKVCKTAEEMIAMIAEQIRITYTNTYITYAFQMF